MLKHVLPRIVLLFGLLLAACAPLLKAPSLPEPLPSPEVPASPQPLPSPVGDWKIVLQQSGGIAGVLLTVEVDSSGMLTAENQRTHRKVTQQLSPETLAQLMDLYSGAALAAPKDKFTGCMDCFIYQLTFSSGGRNVDVQVNDTTLTDSGLRDLITLLQKLRDDALSTAP